jgi:glycerophosphoryl diester phosphodiesterase
MNSIISHRGIFDTKETSIESIKKCVQNDIGIEIDLRIKDNLLYISHDMEKPSLFFDEVCSVLIKSKSQNAFHIKEYDAIDPTIDMLKKYGIKNCFLFTTDDYKLKENDIVGSASYLNSPQDIFNKILWCDESVSKWFIPEVISNLKHNNNNLIAISEEILTNCSVNIAKLYWNSLNKMGFDGICTNYPLECKSFFVNVDKNN